MTRRVSWLLVIAVIAGVAAWVGASELDTPARVVTALLVGVLPLLLAAQIGIDPKAIAETPVEAAYFTSMVLIWSIGALAFWAGNASGFTAAEMGLGPVHAVTVVLWGGAVTLGAVLFGLLGRALGLRESEMLEWLLPESGRERAMFVALSVSAGIGEEMAYRAFLIPALERASGSLVLAVVVSSLAFGMMHGYQLASGALRASVLGALLALPMVFTGSIVPSMVAHALYDVLAGVLLTDLFVPNRRRPRRPETREH